MAIVARVCVRTVAGVSAWVAYTVAAVETRRLRTRVKCLTAGARVAKSTTTLIIDSICG